MSQVFHIGMTITATRLYRTVLVAVVHDLSSIIHRQQFGIIRPDINWTANIGFTSQLQGNNIHETRNQNV